MHYAKWLVAAALAAGAAMGTFAAKSAPPATASPPLAAPAPYAGIPPGFDYPADKAQLDNYRATQNEAALRLHAWMLFAGATQAGPDGTPHWETWYREDYTFRPAGPQPQGPLKRRFPFKVPVQFKVPGLHIQAPGQSLLSFVLFNQETYDHIRDPNAPLYLAATLDKLNASYPAGTAWDKRVIPPFPARAMSLKTAWWPVAGDKMTKMPVWDNATDHPELAHGFNTWKRIVAVDATRASVPAGETTQQFPVPGHPTANVVGRDRIYLIPVTQEIIQATKGDSGLQIAVKNAIGRDFRLGDYVALVGMHMTSKEIDDWTWQTFWWHDDPDHNPFGSDRPAKVTGVWRNYVMAVADDEVTPKQADGTPHVAYNPWLEAGFPASAGGNGIVSNCMACHHLATVPDVSFFPVRRGAPDPANDAAYQGNRLRTDFLWSIPRNAQ